MFDIFPQFDINKLANRCELHKFLDQVNVIYRKCGNASRFTVCNNRYENNNEKLILLGKHDANYCGECLCINTNAPDGTQLCGYRRETWTY